MKSVKADKQKFTINDICKDIDDWAESWAGDDEDIPVGEQIVSQIKLFLNAQISKGRAKSTLKNHSHYLWSLGGEIIRDVNTHDHNKNLNDRELVMKYTSEIGGPLWRHAYDKEDHKRYDSVCRLIYKFLNNS